MSSPDPQVIAHALSAFLSSGTPRVAIDCLREHADVLVSDRALEILDYNLRRQGDDPETQAIFGLRRRAIVAARDHGIEAGIAELYRPTGIEQSLLAALNAEGYSAVVREMRANPALLSSEAVDFVDALLARHAGQDAVQGQIRQFRAILVHARASGVESARSWIAGQLLGALQSPGDDADKVDGWKDVVELLDAPGERHTRAQAQINLAHALRQLAARTKDDRPLELAITHLEQAVRELAAPEYLRDCSGAHRVLGNLYFSHPALPAEERARQAYRHFDLALPGCDPGNLLHLHYMMASCQETLGSLSDARRHLQLGLSWVKDARLDQSVSLCQQLAKDLGGAGAALAHSLDATLVALSGKILGAADEDLADPLGMAATQFDIANVFRTLHGGDRALHLERALAHSQCASRLWRDRDPMRWAQAEANIGVTYIGRVAGDAADNIEQAIEHLQNALRAHTREASPDDWAIDASSLAAAWLRRLKGDRIQNAAKAAEILEPVVDHYKVMGSPLHRAECAGLMGTAMLTLAARDDSALATAEHFFSAALRIATGHGLMNSIPQFASNLTAVHVQRGNFAAAQETARQALAAVDKDTQSYLWASIRYNEAALYSNLEDADRDAHVVHALGLLRECLEIYDARRYPMQRRDVQAAIGKLCLRRGDIAAALDALRDAIDTGESVYAESFTEQGRLSAAGQMASIYRHAAYCLARLGQPGQALLMQEHSRTRVLAEALVRDAANFDELPPGQRAAATEARAEVARLEDEMRQPDDRPGRHADAELGRLLRQARDRLAHAVALGSATALSLDQMLAQIPAGGAMAMPLLTAWGGVLLIVPGGTSVIDERQVHAVDLTQDEADALLLGDEDRPGLLRAYHELLRALGGDEAEEKRRALNRYRAKVRKTCELLWSRLMEPLHQRLHELRLAPGAPLLIIPHGSLGLLPLHAASPPEGVPVFVRRYHARYAPSLSVLAHISARGRPPDSSRRLLAISDPRGDLPFAKLECTDIAASFGGNDSRLLEGSQGTAQAFMEARGATHLHLACHGFFAWGDPLRSGLLLAEDSTLDVATFMSPRVDLGSTCLVTLSACESGLAEFTRAPDEYLGLPAALLMAGAPCVVSTLWAVQDRCTSLLMSEFYRRIQQGIAAADALARAQDWLANLTLDGLKDWVTGALERHRHTPVAGLLEGWLAELRSLDGQRGDTRVFADPYYWAAFTAVGAS